MKINEIFPSIQGEGTYSGYPVLFVRLSGCNRKCSFCDSSYHTEGKEMSIQELANIINKNDLPIIVFTGGEPLLQRKELILLIGKINNKEIHLETNGDLEVNETYFDYICYSPKDLKTAKKLFGNININNDIKVVTDLEINKELIPYATMLMPLTTYDKVKDRETEQHVWNYCVKNNKRFCLRQHVHVWNDKKGV